MILIIDNYDSFTYNLYQYVGECVGEEEILVKYNDALTLEEIERLNPRSIIISPGPKYPKDAGICIELIRMFASSIPILGICLGHQAIGEAFGSIVLPAKTMIHGKATPIHIACASPIFVGLPPIIEGGRYHSLIIERESLGDELRIIAEDEAGEIMGIAHRTYPVYGIQFHPESILTPEGKKIIANFLEVGKDGKVY